jgi:iron complex transport system substrate-binding protein
VKRLLFIIVLIPLLVSACSAPAATQVASTSFTVTDALGRQVTFASTPQHIVITGKAFFMISNAVYAFPESLERVTGLGVSGQAAGGFTSLLDPQYEAKAVLESGTGAEQIASLTPDLVILKSYLSETLGKSLEAIQIPVVYVDFETPEQYQRDLLILGQVFQDEARATELAAYYQGRVDSVQSAVGGMPKTPRTLMLYYSATEGNVAFNVPPMSWMQTQMVQAAGGEPVWGDANPGSGWTTVTLEQIAAWDADQIFIIDYQGNSADTVASLKEDPQWQAIRAVQEGHLWGFPGDFYSWDQPDTRWTLGLYWMAAHLHPAAFPDYDAVQDAAGFYQTVYNMDEATFTSQIQPLLKGDLSR